MKTRPRWIGVLLLLLSLASHGEEIRLLTEEYKPFQYENDQGQVVGFGIDLIESVFKKAGISIKHDTITLLPWARAYDVALNVKNAGLFMTVRTEAREPLFKWVGPLAPRQMWLYKLRSRKDLVLHNLQDAKNYRIGGYNKSADTEYMQKMGLEVMVVTHQNLLANMLMRDRLDLISSLELTMAYRLRDLGLKYESVEKALLLDGRYDYYLALNRDTPDELVQQLQAALEALKADGEYALLWTRYLDPMTPKVADQVTQPLSGTVQ